MLRIYIDSQELYLGEDFSLELHVTNPFFSEEGSHTYDIDVDLRVPQNARIFGNIDRLNVTNQKTSFTAKVTNGPRTLLSGEVFLLELKSKKLKIQIVTKEVMSALFSDSLRISDLSGMGYIQNGNEEAILSTLDEGSDKGWVFCPIMTSPNEFLKPDGKKDQYLNLINRFTYDSISLDKETSVCPQPKLIFVIKRVFASLGWELDSSYLDNDPVASRLIVVHGYRTQFIREMIPNWTVKKFVSEVESFFNIVFSFNLSSKKVSIHSYSNEYQNAARIDIPDSALVFDEAEYPSIKLDDEKTEDVSHSYQYAAYSFPSSPKYKYADFPDELLGRVGVVELDTLPLLVPDNYKNEASLKRAEVFLNKDTGFYYKLQYRASDESIPTEEYYWEPVMCFQHIGTKTADIAENNLSICPAQVLDMAMDRDATINNTYVGAAIPYAINSGELIGGDGEDDFDNWIQNGVPEAKDTSSDKLYVAIYAGWEQVLFRDRKDDSDLVINGSRYLYPQCLTSPFINHNYFSTRSGNSTIVLEKILKHSAIAENWETYDLSLKKLSERYFNTELEIDLSSTYTLAILTPDFYDIRSVFLIHGKKFYCKELVYKYEAGRRLPYVTGTFFAVK